MKNWLRKLGYYWRTLPRGPLGLVVMIVGGLVLLFTVPQGLLAMVGLLLILSGWSVFKNTQ